MAFFGQPTPTHQVVYDANAPFRPGEIDHLTGTVQTISGFPPPHVYTIRERIERGDFPWVEQEIPGEVLKAIEQKEVLIERYRAMLEEEEKGLRALLVLFGVEKPE